ncbi:AAA family ATPase [Candidatus Dojkabacteria bacterium]|jgi:DNA polymerase III delta prime subunit|nr:AAA family ATPase [Candidatus Dojkabacteria bacterium]
MQENNESILKIYYPKIWDDLILPQNILKLLKESSEKKGFRFLFYSSPGTGKTTAARIITIGHDVLYLSGSNDFKIETLRQKIYPFASNHSVFNKQKTIIIDEASRIRLDLQEAFKTILDQSSNVNFIFITNEPEKMNDAVFSRFIKIDFDFSGSELTEQKQNFVKYTLKVLKEQNIKHDTEGVKKLFQLNYPNFRNLLYHIEELKTRGLGITIETVKLLSDAGKQDLNLYKIVTTPSIVEKEFYEEVSKYKGKEKEALLSLGEPFFLYLNEQSQFEKTLQSAIIISKYSADFIESINKFLTFFTCIVELKTLFR